MDLYGLPPEAFTAARDAAAKTDRSLKALRRPTVSAWVVNCLVRAEPAMVDDLAALGKDLLAAQSHGQGPELRALTEQRRRLVGSVTRHALDLVGREVSSAAAAEVEATLEAALADPASAEAVRSGQLVRPLSYSGFGDVDLDGAVAPLPRVPTPAKPRTPGKKDAAAAEARAHEAAGRLDDAVHRAEKAARAVDEHAKAVDAASAHEADAQAEVEKLARRLAEAEAALRDAHKARLAAAKDQEALLRKASAASKAVESAQEEAAAARLALDAVRRG